MFMEKVQFLIGAGTSGSGKTTLALGLMRALCKRGLKVQPFKCGPDYIDTKHHAAATGRASINLDTFLASSEHVKTLYTKYGRNADACVTEGVMGLFDGYSKAQGSSADIATILDIPVIIVVNSKSMAYSAASMLFGLKNFMPGLNIAGVIFNFVSSEKHYTILRKAAEDAGIPSLGYIRREAAIEIPSRHLGLNIDSDFCFDKFADLIASEVEKSIDLDRIIEICTRTFPENEIPGRGAEGTLKISVARDEAFNFYYEENVDILRHAGQVTFFSPLHDSELPPTDFLYLPGGYPELHLPELSQNRAMLSSVREYCNGGGKVFAECGGMMYLCEKITDKEGNSFDMAAVLPRQATIERMKLTLGYRKVVTQDGREFRGHEFHYSRLLPGAGKDTTVKVLNARNESVESEILRYKNVLATYIHFYWGEHEIPISQIF